MAERSQIVVKGVVQGVGFRPFVFTLAESLGLKGYVVNTSGGVLIDVEGDRVSDFVAKLRADAPPLSWITECEVTPLPVHGYTDFVIHLSHEVDGNPFTLVSPDVSLCNDCLRELLDPTDRRYLYPFINCTNCGPRYSITRTVPYDRPNTTMSGFTMCPECQAEYDDPRNRRFHAQPNACAVCGPRITFKIQDSKFKIKSENPLLAGIHILSQGGIIAVKGIGGFHIACDAANDDAVKRLRDKKRKSNKPFALMMPNIASIERYCIVSENERELLLSNRRPIVLLRKRTPFDLPDAVSPNNNYLGCMLPYTPLHYLLFQHPADAGAGSTGPNFKALVMTSGNLSEEPIVRDNEEAVEKLSDIADGFLMHNRGIFMRVDDSVIRISDYGLRNADCKQKERSEPISSLKSEINNPKSSTIFIRRSRGYAPDPIPLNEDGPEVLGCGADLKNTFTLTKGKFAIPSQHIGDMENYETLKFYEECLANLKTVYRAEPVAIAHDLHPGYLSTQWAKSQSASRNPQPAIVLHPIQHHYAHIGSVMAEHGLSGPVIGVAFDGTGYGMDGNLWGGEFMIAEIDRFVRVGQLKYVPLPGGEAAIKEPWKTAVAYMLEAAGERAGALIEQAGFYEKYGKTAVDQIIAISRTRDFSSLSSGMGRLFDAVSALIGICDQNTFEGEAAMALESLVQYGIDDQYVVEFKGKEGYTEIDFGPAIHGIIRDMGKGIGNGGIATKFHNTVATIIQTMVRKMNGQFSLQKVALSGGSFQNQYLLNRVVAMLEKDGMQVYLNNAMPCNDACISLGQAYLVRERLKKTGVRG